MYRVLEWGFSKRSRSWGWRCVFGGTLEHCRQFTAGYGDRYQVVQEGGAA